MTKTEKKEIIRYSQYIEVNHKTLKVYRDKGEEMPKEEIEKAIADALRRAIAELFYGMGRYYADFEMIGDPLELTWKTDMPLPPTEIIITLETCLWDTQLVMKVIEK